MHVKYYGEFSWELAFVLPYCNWAASKGIKIKTSAAKGTESLYFFSSGHTAHGDRTQSEGEQDRLNRLYRIGSRESLYSAEIDTKKWVPPDYKNQFKNDRFVYSKPIYIINNKYTEEWGTHPSVHGNFIPLETLDRLLEKLTKDYQVVYIRPHHSERGFSPDGHLLYEYGDYNLIQQKFPDVITIQALLERNSDLDFNTLQLMLHANCDNFISVVGGNALFSSYFGGRNIIYGKKTRLGPAIGGYWKDLSNAELVYVQTEQDLIDSVDVRSGGLSLRRMGYKDVEFFNEVRNECREWLHDPTKYSVSESLDWFMSSEKRYYILEQASNKIGYFRTSDYDDKNNTIYIGLDIHKDYRGLKLSIPAYLELFKVIRKDLGVRVAFLRVLKKNKRAKYLYDKLGFKVVDETDNDFLMYLNITNAKEEDHK